LVDDSSNQAMPAVSPNGQWLAYVSNGTGQNEVYARPFEGPGSSLQISEGGGSEPAWAPDGQRIYYRTKGALMAATISTPTLAVTARTPQFNDMSDNTMPHRNYDVSPDGSGFLMIAPATAAIPEAVVVLNWVVELREQLAR
jgi:Tol biopolymer transport system component